MENKKNSWKKKAALAYGLFLLLGTSTGLYHVNSRMHEAERAKTASAARAENERDRAKYAEIEGMNAPSAAGTAVESGDAGRERGLTAEVSEPKREIFGEGENGNQGTGYGKPSGIKGAPEGPYGRGTAGEGDSRHENGGESGVEQIVREGDDGYTYIKTTGRDKEPTYVQVPPTRAAMSRYFRIFTNAQGEITGTEQGRGYFDEKGHLVLGTREASCYSFVREGSDFDTGELKRSEQFYPKSGKTVRIASAYATNSDLIKDFTEEREKELRKLKEGFENGK